MNSNDYISMATIIPIWIVCLWRLRYIRQSPGHARLFQTFLCLAIAATLRLSVIERAAIAATGIEDIVSLTKHLTLIICALLLLRWVDSIVEDSEETGRWRQLARGRPSLLAGIGAFATACAAFPLATPAIVEPNGNRNFLEAQYGHGGGTLYLLPYLGFLSIALTLSALLCTIAARRARKAGQRLLQGCMHVMATGCWVGVLYFSSYLLYLGTGLVGLGPPFTEKEFENTATLVQILSILLILLGSSVRGLDTIVQNLRYRRWLITLRPMWSDLVAILPPEAIAKILGDGPSATNDRRDLRNLWERLDQRILDINDTALEVRPWVEADLPEKALDAARRLGLNETKARAAAEAYCLQSARNARADQQPYATMPSAVPVLAISGDLNTNAQWLTLVASYYGSKTLRDIDADLRDTTARTPA